MEYDAEEESPHVRLERCELVSYQIFKIEVPVKELMNKSVPFPCLLFNGSAIPKVLIELSISET